MRYFLAVIVFALSIPPVLSAYASKIDKKLIVSAQKAMSATVGDKALQAALEGGRWNADKTAVVVVVHRSKGSIVFIFIRKDSGEYLAVDASGVERSNFGKLGFGRSYYERFETIPVEWLDRDDPMFQVSIRTSAWKNGQRFTVYEPLLFKADGTILWR